MWQAVFEAAVKAGHPNPRASADRYMQGWELRQRVPA
jgi:hypothetical protein